MASCQGTRNRGPCGANRVTLAEGNGNRPIGFAYDTLRPAAQVGESLSVEEHEDVLIGVALSQPRQAFPRLDETRQRLSFTAGAS